MAATVVRASFERRKGRAETNVVRGTVLLEGGVVQLFIGRSRQLLCHEGGRTALRCRRDPGRCADKYIILKSYQEKHYISSDYCCLVLCTINLQKFSPNFVLANWTRPR